MAVIAPLVMSVAVKVEEPAVFGVTESVLVPATSAVLAGSVAFESELVIATVSVEVTGFQLASTALTVTLNDAACGLSGGCAGLAAGGAGAAVSPGSRIWSLLKAAALIVVAGLVLAVIAPLLMSVAVKVFEPAVFA